jgi:hypothetical protein
MADNLLDQTNDNQPLDPNKDYLQELVGEGKKFKSPQELARGKAESDEYIKILERRSDELRNDYLRLRDESTSRARLEELIDQLQKQSTQPVTSNNQPSVNEPPLGKPDPNNSRERAEIESLVSSKILEHEATKKQQENFELVRNKLKERYGSNYQNLLKEQLNTLGLSEDFANDLARRHPNVLFKTLGLDAQPQENFQSPPRSNQRSDNFAPSTTKRTWSYYQKMKKENPKVYFDPKTTVQMHNDAIALGKEFEDGDFNAY